MPLISKSVALSDKSPQKKSSSPQSKGELENLKAGETGRKNPKIRTLIADDEPVAREALRLLLNREQDVEIIGISGTGREAADAINKLAPDLVFLDVEMPELNGFDVLKEIRRPKMPAVIFVTANEEFAARAFDVHAMDYLVKPCRRDRLQIALQRVRERMNQCQASQLHEKVEALITNLRQEPRAAERIAIKSGGRILFLRLADIDWIEAADNYVNLHVGQESHLLRETMNALEARLSSKRFVRVSRSATVNIEHIKELQPLFHGEYLVLLRDGTRLTLTRGYREKVRELSLI
jgi:two-component system LytT family response regulator